jgi:hypothetical protein
MMQTDLKPPTAETAGRARPQATDERRELALLAEFIRCESVASLASDIAERLGADARGEDLIAAAGLGGHSRTSASGDGSRSTGPTQSRRPTAD